MAMGGALGVHAQQGRYPVMLDIGKQYNLQGSNWTGLVVGENGAVYAHSQTGGVYRIHQQQVQPLLATVNTIPASFQNSILFYQHGFYIHDMANGMLFKLLADSLHPFKAIRSGSTFILGKGVIFFEGMPQPRKATYFDGHAFTSVTIPALLPATNTVAWQAAALRHSVTGELLLAMPHQQGSNLYRFDEKQKRFIYWQYFNAPPGINWTYYLPNDQILYYPINTSTANVTWRLLDAQGNSQNAGYTVSFVSNFPAEYVLQKNGEQYLIDFKNRDTTAMPLPRLLQSDKVQQTFFHKQTQAYYVGTTNRVTRIFQYVWEYPQLYNQNNSNANHTIIQTANGDVYIGSYTGAFTQITNKGIVPMPNERAILPGGLGVGNTINFFSENWSGLVQITGTRQRRSLTRLKPKLSNTGFYLTYNRDSRRILAGFGGDSSFGMMPVKEFMAGSADWTSIGPENGVQLANILTLAEDPKGRIIFGRTSQGWGVYDSISKKATSYLKSNKQTHIGVMSSFCDSYGTMWLGTDDGLWYYDGNKTGSITPTSLTQIQHPLLAEKTNISALKQWGNYLLIGKGQRLLLLPLQPAAGYAKQVALLRYLHPFELPMATGVEQNAMLVDHRDSSVWVATTDNVFQVMLKPWLQQTFYKAEPSISIITGTDTLLAKPDRSIQLPPTSNSLAIDILYQCADNLPRLLQVALVAEGDSIRWSNVTLDHHWEAFNKQTGKYTFYVRVFEQSGVTYEYAFPITIRKFLWQHWWFWTLLSIIIIAAFAFYLNLRKRKQIAEAEAKRMQAETNALRSEQNRQLTNMQVKSLSNQFRPHFILNALNTVGAQLYDKPEVDEVLGQLGDSIGIIFRNSQQGSIAHAFAQEWKLVQSVINIKQMEYHHAVTVHYPDEATVTALAEWQLPMGILQIPVENALIHGLRNKETGSKHLYLGLQETPDHLLITIEDNGIGRKAAATMTNHRNNGVGTKNLLAIVDLLNQHNTAQLHFNIADVSAPDTGTKVSISIPKQYSYAL